MNQKLPDSWIDKLFSRLQGVYGRQFIGQYSQIVGNIDEGLANAKQIWAEELGCFYSNPDCIANALKNLPDRSPNLIQFKELCRQSSLTAKASLPYILSDEEKIKQKKVAAESMRKIYSMLKVNVIDNKLKHKNHD